MIEPKFKIGDWVNLRFEQEIEGVPVVVRKRAVIYGILHVLTSDSYKYLLCENVPSSKQHPGRSWERGEHWIEPLEPLINEIEKARAAT